MELTRAAVSSAVAHSRTMRVRPTWTPRVAAASWPKAKASSVRAWPRQTSSVTPSTAEQIHTSLQPTPPSEPSSQNSTPRVCSASAAVITTKEVSAEEELHGRDAGQDDPVGAAAEGVTEQHDQGEGAHGPDERPGRQGDRSPADPEDDHDDGAGRGSGGDPEDERIGERVAQQRLHDGAADREPRAADGGEQGARHAQVPDDAVTDRAEPRLARAEVGGDRGPDVGDGDPGRADGDGDGDGQGEQQEPTGPQESFADTADAPEAGTGARGRVLARRRGLFGVRHPASPKVRRPAATSSTPSTVRMVGFIAWPLSST